MPGKKPASVRLSEEEFLELAERAFDEIPLEFRGRIHNVEVAVQARPGAEAGRWRGSRSLMGLYTGMTREEMLQTGGAPCLPARIILYQRNIESCCHTMPELEREVRATLRHELAHHFGFDDRQLDRLWPAV